jgi:DNA-binding transcriptional MerR regulator
MAATLSIGDFSRATNLSVKTLRYYHRVGLLAPAGVDPHTSYRRYTVDQISPHRAA